VSTASILILLGRTLLISYGLVVGQGRLRSLTLLTGALIAASFFLFIRPRPSIQNSAAAIALVAALFATLETIAPSTPELQQAPGCRGAQVQHVPYVATTTALGANARVGAGRSFPQIIRFSNGCTLGFVGYCIGESTQDVTFNTPDVRWLLLPKGQGLVAAGVVISQSAEKDLPFRPCPGGIPPLPRLTLEPPEGLVGGLVTLTATAPRASAVGFALLRPASTSSNEATFVQISVDTMSADGFTATWDTSLSAAHGPGPVTVLAVDCLAAEVPLQSTEVTTTYVLGPNPSPPTTLSNQDRQRLRQTACLLEGYPKPPPG
jgi:hypothetical protein